jgi:AhpD family alkylhydroperoxidase
MSTTTQTSGRVDIEQDAPALYRAMVALDRPVGASGLDRRLWELLKVRTSQLNGCAYRIDLHTRDALEAGESQRRLFAVAAWRESALFSDGERAALALTDAVTRLAGAEVPDAVYEEAARRFSRQQVAALLHAIVTINGWNRLAVSTHMVFEA